MLGKGILKSSVLQAGYVALLFFLLLVYNIANIKNLVNDLHIKKPKN